VQKIRNGLQAAGLKNSTIQTISDSSDIGSRDDVMIGLAQSSDEDTLDAGKQKILDVLQKTFGTEASGLADFNAASPAALAADLLQKDPLSLGVNAGNRYTQLGNAITSARDSQHDGIVTNFDQLSNVPGVTPAVIRTLQHDYSLSDFTVRNAETVGPTVGAQLRRQALWATLYALAGMLVYVAFRFEWVYGAAAVIAVFHDVLITLGFFSLFHYEISLTVIAALLTLVGYSMNDTIVIFDRVRENLRLMRRESFPEIINKSINQTLSRTILTSGLTLLTVLVLYLLGGEVLRSFSFAMVVGVVVGTYSSFGIAAPIVVVWNRFSGGKGAAVRAGSAAGKRVPAAARR
ncbi:MAG: protein translocase subunit SecF, partial [Candidatus Acidiferrales bacterium]